MADPKTGETRRHCWHVQRRSPPQYIPEVWEVCCHCGATRYNHAVAQPGHGRFASPVWLPGEWEYHAGADPDVCGGDAA